MSGAWIGEGLSTPVAASAYSAVQQEDYKAGKIVVLSAELLKFGNRSAERTIRESMAAGVGKFLDGQLLDPTVTLSAGVRPAAITNGATAVMSTGTTAAQINADLAALLAAITTDGAGLVWVMRPQTAAKIAATIGGTAAVNVPLSLFGIPLVLSANSPQQVTLIDTPHILFSDDGGIDIDTSDDATVQLNDAPTDPAVAATVFQSLWNNNLFGIRVTRWVAWLRAQSGAVSYMTVGVLVHAAAACRDDHQQDRKIRLVDSGGSRAPIREALAKRDAQLAQLEARIQDAERRLRDMETKSTVKRFSA